MRYGARVRRSKAWAIRMGEGSNGFIGHGRFGWLIGFPHAEGLTICLWQTRRKAREALPKVKHTEYGFPKAYVVQVEVALTDLGR